MTKQNILWMLIITTALFSGCTEQQQKAPEPVCLAGTDIESAMHQAEMVLFEMNFVIDKSDSTAGLMRTLPLPSSQFFEFWKKDNADAYNAAMSNIHSMQKTVELNFTQNKKQLCINCNVKVERLSIPEKDIDSAARSYGMFTESSETSQNLSLTGDQLALMEWVDLGRDNKLEAAILKRIGNKLTDKKGGK